MCATLHLWTSAPVTAFHRRTVKSAAAVTAMVASSFRWASHTAPSWPAKVPIQSPVSPSRSMGCLSVHGHQTARRRLSGRAKSGALPVWPARSAWRAPWQAEMRKTPSSVLRLKWMPTTPRAWPGQITCVTASSLAIAAAQESAGGAAKKTVALNPSRPHWLPRPLGTPLAHPSAGPGSEACRGHGGGQWPWLGHGGGQEAAHLSGPALPHLPRAPGGLAGFCPATNAGLGPE